MSHPPDPEAIKFILLVVLALAVLGLAMIYTGTRYP
jgi:hypothetical protein